MEPNCKGQVRDALSTWRVEFTAALGGTWQWSDLVPDSDTSASSRLEDSSPGDEPPSPVIPAPLGNVTSEVAGANGASSGGGNGAGMALGADTTAVTQVRISLPTRFSQALTNVPTRLRNHVLLAALFGPLGGGQDLVGFLSAARELERSRNILRQLGHIGLPSDLAGRVDTLIKWIGRACNLRRDDCVSHSPRFPDTQAQVLLDLQPPDRHEYVRLVLSYSRAGISVSCLVSEDYRIRIACDAIIWNLELDSQICPVAETVPLIDVLEFVRQGGSK